jgi:hypothetical protein
MLEAQFCWLRIERSAKQTAIKRISDAISDWMPRWIMLLSMGMAMLGKIFLIRCPMLDG